MVVLEQGDHWHEDRMNRSKIQKQDVVDAIRSKGMEREEQFTYAMAERNGSISIIPMDEEQ